MFILIVIREGSIFSNNRTLTGNMWPENFHSFTTREARFNSFSSKSFASPSIFFVWFVDRRQTKETKKFWSRRMSTTDCSKAKNWGPVYFKRSALLGRIKNRICLVRLTAFILALDSPGRTKSMLSRYIFHDLDSSPAKSTRYRLVQFLKQLFSRYDSSTAYCFPRSISRWGWWA